MKSKHMGSTLDSFLEEEGILEEATAQAQKRVLAYQLDAAMKEAGITKAELARRMKTSRTQVDSLLNPENVTFRMDSAMKAARAVGKRIELALV
tara:strand:+ start:1422 stop:1703 length:282 start_codon:yes stop_codon:yes gene_type:complete